MRTQTMPDKPMPYHQALAMANAARIMELHGKLRESKNEIAKLKARIAELEGFEASYYAMCERHHGSKCERGAGE